MTRPVTAARKSLSKRLRCDVFKRDDFTCQYCGAHPPAVVLECDHVVPVAEGGENDFYNLVTACMGCNRGKAAIPLSVVPQSLADKAAEVAEREEQLRGYGAVMEARRQRIEDDVWRVMGVLYPGQQMVPRADFASAQRFVEKLGVHRVLEAADIAIAGPARYSKSFKYFCGVCWNMIREMEGKV